MRPAIAAWAGIVFGAGAYATVLSSDRLSLTIDVPGGVGLGAAYTDWLRMAIPLPLIGATVLFGLILSALEGRTSWTVWARVAATGVFAHLNALLVLMSSLDLSAMSTAQSGYARAVLALLTSLCFAVPFAAVRMWRNATLGVLASLIVLPLGQLIFRQDRVTVVLVAILGMVAVSGLLRGVPLGAPPWRLGTVAAGCVIFAAALGARVLYAWGLGRAGLDMVLSNAPDAGYYYANALKLMRGEVVSSQFSPGYSGFLAAALWIADERAVLLVHALLGALVPVLVFSLASRVADRRTAWVAAAVATGSGLLIYNSANLTRESLGILIFTASALAVIGSPVWKPLSGTSLGLGALWGFAVVVDPVFFVVIAAALLALTIRHRSSRASLVATPVTVVIALIVAIALDLLITGSPTPLARDAATAIHVSTDFNPHSMELAKIGVQPLRDPLGSLAAALARLDLAAPLLAAKLLSDVRTFFFGGSPGSFDLILLARNSPISAAVVAYGYAAAALGVLVLVRRASTRTQERWAAATLLGLIAAYSLTYIVVFFGMTRFRAAVHPALLVLTAIGVMESVRWSWREMDVQIADRRAGIGRRGRVDHPLAGEISPQS